MSALPRTEAGLALPLRAAYRGEDVLHVGRGRAGYVRDATRVRKAPVRTRYLVDPAERERFRVRVVDGVALGVDGEPWSTAGMHPGTKGWDKRSRGRAIFTLDLDGRLYACDPTPSSPSYTAWRAHRRSRGETPFPEAVEIFHHSSFVGGGPVRGAGEIGTDGDGRVVVVSNLSGHYHPGTGSALSVLEWLRDRGVDLDGTVHEHFDGARTLAWRAGAFHAAGGDPARLGDPLPHRLAGARLVAAQHHRRDYDAESTRLLDRAARGVLAVVETEGTGRFDPARQVHWNWLAIWVLDRDRRAMDLVEKTP